MNLEYVTLVEYKAVQWEAEILAKKPARVQQTIGPAQKGEA